MSTPGENVKQPLIPRHPSHVLRRAGPFAGQAPHLGEGLSLNGFEDDPVLPAVAEVVLVRQAVSERAEHLVQTHVNLRRAVIAFLNIELRGEGRDVALQLARAHPEGVEVAIGPTHRGLEHVMESIKGEVAGHHHLPPDGWLDVLEFDPQHVGHTLCAARKQSGLSLCGQRHPRVRAKAHQEPVDSARFGNDLIRQFVDLSLPVAVLSHLPHPRSCPSALNTTPGTCASSRCLLAGSSPNGYSSTRP